MNCINPFPIKSEDGHILFLAPCGKCNVCRVQRSNQWALRCMHELKQYGNKAVFVTLTYNEENLPKNKTLVKDDLQKFWKRLRKNLKGRKISYFACGEYGSRYDRPHYHAIIFGLDPFSLKDKDVLKKSWTFCNWEMLSHYFEPVSFQNCRYITKYLWQSKEKSEQYIVTERQTPFYGVFKRIWKAICC